jgi:hypothetical protein
LDFSSRNERVVIGEGTIELNADLPGFAPDDNTLHLAPASQLQQ